MIVLTHKDKLRAEDVELKRQQLFHDIEKMFSGSTLLSHLVIEDQVFVNAEDGRDPEMAKIKKIITEQAFQQPTWGQELPKCFIPLEVEFDSLLSRNIPLISMEHMRKMNSLQLVRPLTDDEIKVFLKFQHSVGRILYFGESKLDEYIILSPTHLIDAFKSIVTDRRFCAGDRLRQESWDLMSTKGVIGKKSIEDIWKQKKYKKFQDHKEYLLGVMTHLDILVEPIRYDNSHRRIPAEFYYVASMVKANDTSGYMNSATFFQRNIALAFTLSTSMLPPALCFRFISYCLSMFAVKSYGQKNEEMLFHRSAVFTIDPSLDMCITCDDATIIVRLVHDKNRTLIMKDLASSIRECLTAALEKISQLYIRTCSTEFVANRSSFNLSLCCSSADDPCILPIKLHEQVYSWICPKHGIEHTKDILSSWEVQQEELQCGDACPVTDNAFLAQQPSDLHLRRLSMQYSIHETKELVIYLGMQFSTWDDMYVTLCEEPQRFKFETMRRCIGDCNKTFNDIKHAIEVNNIQDQHTLCKVVRGNHIDFDKEPEKWDLIATEEHLDRVAPLVGNNSLPFLVELGMEFKTWEQVKYRQKEKDLVKLNRDILQEWKSEFCVLHQLRPSLRYIGQAFNNIDKNIKIIENVLADLF